MEFHEIVMKRYATKKFDGRKVPEKTFSELMELIRYSASSYNIQPWRFIVVTDDKTKKQLKKAAYLQPQIDTCSHLIVICADTRLLKLADRLESLLKKNKVPLLQRKAYLTVVRSSMKKSPEEALIYAQKQCYLALGNAINGAKALGLDSCPMEGFDREKFAEILALPDHLVPTVICPVGYAADEPHKKMRFDDVVTFL
ncbi:MAG: NAD(P)H-dependent oxidoreductase [DPANN group archaeon]|nr:NAD(P)H-dependent oxidoreductase [DPANN group archaeon]